MSVATVTLVRELFIILKQSGSPTWGKPQSAEDHVLKHKLKIKDTDFYSNLNGITITGDLSIEIIKIRTVVSSISKKIKMQLRV